MKIAYTKRIVLSPEGEKAFVEYLQGNITKAGFAKVLHTSNQQASNVIANLAAQYVQDGKLRIVLTNI